MNLIVGGTGALGSAVARRLRTAGESVRVMTRTPAKAAALAAEGVEVVQGDLLNRDSLARACSGTEVVVAAAHSFLGRGRSASEHVDGRGHRDLIDAARAADVRHFVYTSVVDRHDSFQTVPLFRIKREIEAYLRGSGLPFTIVRATAFMEVHAHMVIGEPILRNGRAVLFGRGEQPRNYVAADDIARIMVAGILDRSMMGETIEVGGPENLTAREVVRIYERLSGRPARVLHVPLAPLRLMSRLIRPLHPGVSQMVRAGVLGDAVDQRFDAQPLQERFGFPLTRLVDFATHRAEIARSAH